MVLARRAALALAGAYAALGVAETVRLTVTGDGGVLFWSGSLLGGAALLLLGALRRSASPDRRRVAAVVVGAVLGLPATAWTLVVPLLAVAVVLLTLRSAVGAVESGG